MFADAGTGLYNVHGQYMTAFERHTGLTMRWLGNPGTFGHCLAVIRRAGSPAFLFEFDSYAIKYAEAGLPVHNPAEIQLELLAPICGTCDPAAELGLH